MVDDYTRKGLFCLRFVTITDAKTCKKLIETNVHCLQLPVCTHACAFVVELQIVTLVLTFTVFWPILLEQMSVTPTVLMRPERSKQCSLYAVTYGI